MLKLFEPQESKTKPAAFPAEKAALGQYMTPPSIAAFMASFFKKSLPLFIYLMPGRARGI